MGEGLVENFCRTFGQVVKGIRSRAAILQTRSPAAPGAITKRQTGRASAKPLIGAVQKSLRRAAVTAPPDVPETTTKIGAVFMENTTTSPDVLERFLRYVQINTQSEDANCDQVPSSAVQFDLANVLVEELRELGAEDAHVTEHAYVCAHIPASAGAEDKPAGCGVKG